MGFFNTNDKYSEPMNVTPQKTPEEIQAENEKKRKLELMPVSTTDLIDGYRTSGSRTLLSTTVSIDTGYNGSGFTTENETSKRRAVNNLKSEAIEKNCNAIIGLRFEFNNYVVSGYVETYLSAYATGIRIVGKDK